MQSELKQPSCQHAACADAVMCGVPGRALETIRKMQHCCPTQDAGELMAPDIP